MKKFIPCTLFLFEDWKKAGAHVIPKTSTIDPEFITTNEMYINPDDIGMIDVIHIGDGFVYAQIVFKRQTENKSVGFVFIKSDISELLYLGNYIYGKHVDVKEKSGTIK